MLGKVLLFASATTMTALLASGCQGNASISAGSGATATTTAQSAPVTFPGMTTPPPASGGHGSGAAPTSAAQNTAVAPNTATVSSSAGGQFTSKTLHVILTGANSNSLTIKFQLAVFQHDPVDDGSWVPDPGNPGTHQLPLAPAATVLSAASWCPNSGSPTIDAEGVGTGPCTVTQLLEAFGNSTGGLGGAVITTDDQDHIVKIAEIYHP